MVAALWDSKPTTVTPEAPAEPTRTTSRKTTDADTASSLIDALRAAVGTTTDTAARLEQMEAKIDALSSQEPRTLRIQVGENTPGPAIPNARPEVEQIVRRLLCRKPGKRNAWMVGPAGSGKTTLAHTIADALARPFGFQSFAADSTAASLIGGPNAAGIYQETAFIEAYEKGGVYLLDEIDAAPAEILVAVNAALANGHLSLPRHHDPARRMIARHPDCIIIAAANTYGTGATAQYVGRGAIDAATLDRFAGMVFDIGYDQALELALCPDESVRSIVTSLRHAANTHKMRRIVSTRAMEAAADMHAAGYELAEIVEALTQGWTAEEKAKAGCA